ncbi:hypothetical protein K4749_36740 [Streptomyces sp. TRM72054]|uniref:hypothetical protein n=1 Tax=Streptomyces sp. TRM72054 TaxID=2870562 RepID=UPI001C8B2366|nr:hypothetical protein [Streptomyces sp. TRM72054]MBX9398985.1 hypothetical protein [Streptomyces sp. TRM72054]
MRHPAADRFGVRPRPNRGRERSRQAGPGPTETWWAGSSYGSSVAAIAPLIALGLPEDVVRALFEPLDGLRFRASGTDLVAN